jgi:alanine dehydrogenase
MRVGVPKEIKDGERRVGLLPNAVRVLVGEGHDVRVQCGAGASVGFTTMITAARARRSLANLAKSGAPI